VVGLIIVIIGLNIMNFNITRSEILPSLQTVCGVIDRRQALPILSNLLIVAEKDKLVLTGTDMEVEMVTTISHQPETSGEITVPARKLLDICKALPEDSKIGLNFNKDQVLVKSGKSKFTLATLPATEYPSTEALGNSSQIMLPQKEFKALLEDTMFSMAQQDVRYYLNGLLLELDKNSLRAVATDGHRLALKEIKVKTGIEEAQQIIIPRKGVIELIRLLDGEDENINVEVSQNHIRVSKDKVQFTSKLIDGKFPDYQRVIPKEGDHPVKTNRDTLKQGLIRASILSNEKYKGIRLVLQNDMLKAFAHNPEQEEAEEEIEINYKGDDIEIGFNVTYLLDALSSIKTEDVIINISDPNSSCLILPDDDTDCKYVVMPMRL
jgi:DNA polymerase-3 subunit beta